MSHWIKTKCEVKDRGLLKKALTQLGWQFEEGTFIVEQYQKKEKAEILLAKDKQNKNANALGLSLQEDGTWSLVGDPYHCSDSHPLRKYYRNTDQFAKDLSLAYTIADAKERLEEEGFDCTDNDKAVVGPDGKIRMTYQKIMG